MYKKLKFFIFNIYYNIILMNNPMKNITLLSNTPDIASKQSKMKSDVTNKSNVDVNTFKKKHSILVSAINDTFIPYDNKEEDKIVKNNLEERRLKKLERMKTIINQSPNMSKGRTSANNENVIIEDNLNEI